MSWTKKRFSELTSNFFMGGKVIPTYKICQTTMQSQYRWHSRFNIVRNQCVCDTLSSVLVLDQDMLTVATEQGVLLEGKTLILLRIVVDFPPYESRSTSMTTFDELDTEMAYLCCQNNKMCIMDFIFLALTCRCLYLINYNPLLMVNSIFTKQSGCKIISLGRSEYGLQITSGLDDMWVLIEV